MTPSVNVQDEAARQERIMAHMNREHTRELSHILQHFNSVKRRDTTGSSLKDISLNSMTIRAGGLNHNVPFVPVLKSWDQVRHRLIEMDTSSRDALGISDIYITEYSRPRGFDWVVFSAVSFFFVNVLTLPWLVPGSLYWAAVSSVWPWGPQWYRWLVMALIVPVLIIHITEGIFFDYRRMRRHGVERWSALWWTWEISVFLEGVCAWKRIDAMIAQKKLEKEGKKNH